MPKIPVEVSGVGTVYITKKRGQKTMRLRVDNKGQVQVSMPWLVPKSAAFEFIRSKSDWIKAQQIDYIFAPYDGMLLGKTLKLEIKENSTKSRVSQSGRILTVPFQSKYDKSNTLHIDKIQKAVIKALRTEAEKILLPRLREFAQEYGFSYRSSAIKRVVGRWGSCDSNGHILLSLYLIQLPIEYIDYVLFHELAHTRQMNHSPRFWKEVERLFPEYKRVRSEMRDMQPRIYDAKEFMA